MSEKSDSNDSHYDSAKAWRAQAGATVGLFFSIPSILTFGVFLNALLDAHRDHLSRHELTRIRGLAIALAFLLSPLYGLLASVMGPHRLFALAALGVQVGLYATSVAGSTALLTGTPGGCFYYWLQWEGGSTCEMKNEEKDHRL